MSDHSRSRTEPPPGWIVEEDADLKKWRVRRKADGVTSPDYTRRLKAVMWAWQYLGKESATPS